jgi:hypothetical protein
MIEHAAGLRRDYDGPRLAFIVMPKGHSKTSALAQLMSWMLC